MSIHSRSCRFACHGTVLQVTGFGLMGRITAERRDEQGVICTVDKSVYIYTRL